MIGRLSGTLVECKPGEVILDVGGVGYELHVPLSTFYVLSEGPTENVRLFVHTHVRAEALQLFGFAGERERTLFQLLITISGVGPRLALAILSGIGAEELRVAVSEVDRARLQKIPGVGRKTAERVLLELRDKIGAAAVDADGATVRPADGGLRSDAISALLNLGYPEDAARKAVETAGERLGAEAGLEALLRAALSRVVK